MTKNIGIYFNEKNHTYKKHGSDLNVNVKQLFWDTGSKKFKIYRHIIDYNGAFYNPSEYALSIYDGKSSNFIFKCIKPSTKIESVDFFFHSYNTSYDPLVIGFHEERYATKYFTYKHIYNNYRYSWFSTTAFENGLPRDGLFLENELISRLLDELGIYVHERKSKFVIRLGEKPKTVECKYPGGGTTASKITLKKCQQFLWFDKYEHSIATNEDVRSFYVSFNHDSLYMNESDLGRLKFVYVYNHIDKIFIIVFEFEGGNRFCEFHQLKSDMTKQSSDLSDLLEFEENKLTKLLIDEYDTQINVITFLLDQKVNYSSSVNVLYESEDQSHNYIKYTHKINDRFLYTDKSNILLNNKLFKVDDSSNDRAKNVNVYFIKKQVGDVDTEPFLIQIERKFFSKNNNKWSIIDIKDHDIKTKLKNLHINGKDFENLRVEAVQALQTKTEEAPGGNGQSRNSERLIGDPSSIGASSGNSGIVIPIVGGVIGVLATLGCTIGGCWWYKRRSKFTPML